LSTFLRPFLDGRRARVIVAPLSWRAVAPRRAVRGSATLGGVTLAAAPLAGLADRTFTAVLFDMDGTLISSRAVVDRSWARLRDEFDIPAERFGVVHGVPARAIIERMLVDRSAQEREAALHRIVELEVTDTEGVEVLPGAVAALDLLGAAGRCAIVTSSGRPLAAARLAVTGLDAPVVVTADDVEHGKPHPDPFIEGARALGVDPATCLVVEDAPPGIAAARAAGSAVLALTTTYPADRVDGDAVVPDLGAVRFVLTDDGVRVTSA
jgi:mannitol-1-/sugar-/sorbitol-6-phosphatase